MCQASLLNMPTAMELSSTRALAEIKIEQIFGTCPTISPSRWLRPSCCCRRRFQCVPTRHLEGGTIHNGISESFGALHKYGVIPNENYSSIYSANPSNRMRVFVIMSRYNRGCDAGLQVDASHAVVQLLPFPELIIRNLVWFYKEVFVLEDCEKIREAALFLTIVPVYSGSQSA